MRMYKNTCTFDQCRRVITSSLAAAHVRSFESMSVVIVILHTYVQPTFCVHVIHMYRAISTLHAWHLSYKADEQNISENVIAHE